MSKLGILLFRIGIFVLVELCVNKSSKGDNECIYIGASMCLLEKGLRQGYITACELELYVGASMRLLEKGLLQWYLEERYSTICELEPESEQLAQMTYVK